MGSAASRRKLGGGGLRLDLAPAIPERIHQFRLMYLAALISAISLVLRFRHSRGRERLQLK
jgi:hypothetical protein